MAIFLAAVGALSLVVLIGLLVAFAKRVAALTRSLTLLQRALEPALDEIRATSEVTQQLAQGLEERARALRSDDR